MMAEPKERFVKSELANDDFVETSQSSNGYEEEDAEDSSSSASTRLQLSSGECCCLQFKQCLNCHGRGTHAKECFWRRRDSCILRLQQEIHRLEQVEKILADKESAVHGHNLLRRERHKQPKNRETKVRQRSVRYCEKCNEEKSLLLTSPEWRSRLQSCAKDFSQCFPTPSFPKNALSRVDYHSSHKTSVGIQTEFIPSQENELEDQCVIGSVTNDISNTLCPSENGCAISGRLEKAVMLKHILTGKEDDFSERLHSLAWFYPFDSFMLNCKQNVKEVESYDVGFLVHHKTENARSLLKNQNVVGLQDALRFFRPDIINHLMFRQNKLKALQKAHLNNKDVCVYSANVVPHRFTRPLLFSENHHNPQLRNIPRRERKDRTEKIYGKLSEVSEQEKLKAREEERYRNFVKAQLFNRKLQENVLRGKVSLSMSQKCI